MLDHRGVARSCTASAPAVATRENFDANNYTKEGLERLKLEDGIHVHEETKTQLELYARENGTKTVKPFMPSSRLRLGPP